MRWLLTPLRWGWRLALAAIVLLLSRHGERRVERELPASPRAEGAVAGLLFAAALAGVAFVLVYAFDGADTQLLGAAINAVYAFGITFIVFKVINAVKSIRVSPEVELEGLDMPEFGGLAYPEDAMAPATASCSGAMVCTD